MEKIKIKKELPPQEDEYKNILESEGLIYLGIQEGVEGNLVLFKTGDRHSWDASMSIVADEFNIENLRKKIKETEEKFNKDN